MNIFIRILKITASLIIALTVILFSASFFLQGRIAGLLIKSINNNISTRLEIGSSKLSFLVRFPRASLEMKDVLVHSSAGFDYGSFPGSGEDTLLSASSVSVEFRLLDILRGRYNIGGIVIRSGKLYLLSDLAGNVNYEIKTAKNAGGSGELDLNLERIILNDISGVYNNLSTKLLLKADIEKGRIKSRIYGSKLDFSASSSMHISLLQLYDTRITKGLSADLDVSLYDSGDTTLFKKGILKLDDLVFGIEGTILRGTILDLGLKAQNIAIEKALKLLPDRIQLPMKEYDPSGRINVVAEIKGAVTRTLNPHIEITALLDNGGLKRSRSRVSVNNLSFTGVFSNGKKNLPETSTLSIDNIVMKFGSHWLNGSLDIVRFKDPEALVGLKGTIDPGELKEFFDMESISRAGGSADLDVKLRGKIIPGLKYSFYDLLGAATAADINFQNFRLAVKDSDFDVDDANGYIRITDIITADKLSFNYRDHFVKVDGKFINLPGWLAGKGSLPLTGSADLEFNRFDPEQFFGMNTGNAGSAENKSFILPKSIGLNLNFKIDTFRYKTFLGEQVSGILDYNKNELNFKQLRLKSNEGIVSGNGIFFQNNDNSVMVKGIFDLEGIDIKKAFIAFRNFGQDFIKSENLAGTLSGNLSLLLPMDASLNPQIRFLTAEGKYIISNGSLVNFDPVKKLSSYIKVSELENIKFEKLENNFYIRNNFFYVPQMAVSSSAVVLSVNGKHSFDNDYIYHVKMLLSEVLSQKFRRNKSLQSEFGSVEDDGLGRTSLLLKVEGKDDVVKTGYDLEAARQGIKSSMKEEKSSLKSILKEEYGWYKKDTIPAIKKEVKEEKRPRFRVTWDEAGDAVKNRPEIP